MHAVIHLVGSLWYLYMGLVGLSLLVRGVRQPKRRPLELVAFLVMVLGGGLFVGMEWWHAWQAAPVSGSDWAALWQSLALLGSFAIWTGFQWFRGRHGDIRHQGHGAGKGAA